MLSKNSDSDTMPSHSATAPGEIGQASQNISFLQDVSVFEQMAAAAAVAVADEGDDGGLQAMKVEEPEEDAAVVEPPALRRKVESFSEAKLQELMRKVKLPKEVMLRVKRKYNELQMHLNSKALGIRRTKKIK